MIVNFYHDGLKTKIKYPFSIVEGGKFIEKFTDDQKATLAIQLNRWEWDTELLGDFPGAALAKGYANMFRGKVGRYKMFKYELKQQGKTEEEIKEAIIEKLFNLIMMQ